MKPLFTLFAFFVATATAHGETIIMNPGETISNGSTRIHCETPEQARPVCKLLGAGAFRGNTWAYRTGVGDDVIASTDNFEIALDSIKKFRQAGLCGSAPQGTCRMAGPGAARGNTWAYRIAIDSEIVGATDNMDIALGMLAKIRGVGLCP